MKIDADSGGDVDWKEFMNFILLENETLAVMRQEHFEYVKSNIEDPIPSATHLCHKHMITSLIIIHPDLEEKRMLGKSQSQKKKVT